MPINIIFNRHDENLRLLIDTDKVNNSSEEKLLGVTFDNDFACITHVKNICQKAMKAFIESLFGIDLFGNKSINFVTAYMYDILNN